MIITKAGNNRFGGIDSFVELMLHFNGTGGSSTFIDSSFNNYTFNIGGSPVLDATNKKLGSASGFFDGSSYFYTSQIHQFKFLSSWTIDFWIRRTSWASLSTEIVAGKSDTSIPLTTYRSYIWMTDFSGTKAIGFLTFTTGFNSAWFAASYPFVDNTWYHVAVAVVNNVTPYVFINGISQTVDHTFGTDFTDNSFVKPFVFGAQGTDFAYKLTNTWLDEFRFSNGVFRYPNGNFAPPIKEYTTW
jgi:hypothetical protein